MAIINERIKKQRLKMNLTLADVAEAIGVKEATAQRYESGAIKNISHEIICKLSETLHCTPSYLMGWEESPAAMSNENEPTDALLKRLLAYMKLLNPKGIDELLKRASELVQLPQYANKDQGDRE